MGRYYGSDLFAEMVLDDMQQCIIDEAMQYVETQMQLTDELAEWAEEKQYGFY